MKGLTCLLALLGASHLLSCAHAKLVIIGDSWSDNGLDGILAGTRLVQNRFSTGPVNVGTYPPAPYYEGRFTNGYIWVDEAAQILGQQVNNYAAGGANGYTGEILVAPPFAYVANKTSVPVRSLVQQAQAYAALNADAVPTGTDTVVIFGGPDEYQQKLTGLQPGAPAATPDDILSAINETLATAYAAGARSFVLINIPPLSAIPLNAGGDKNAIDTLSSSHNSQLASAATSFDAANPGASTIIYDVNALFTSILAAPANFGTPFTNTTGFARGTTDLDQTQAAGFALQNAPDADDYIFWDVAHPTKHVHQIFGQDFATKTASKTSAALVQGSGTSSA